MLIGESALILMKLSWSVSTLQFWILVFGFLYTHMLRLVRVCGWGVTFCSTSPQTTSFTYQINVFFKNVCLGWGNMCMLVFYCECKRYASKHRREECGVQESGDTLRSGGRVGITTQTHTGREEPRAWIIQPLSVIIAARSAVLAIACVLIPHQYCNTYA